ncbi:MAG: FitA-like ribbon-helix-helix domain-containing protein [Nitrospirota bacterium]
MKSITLSIKNVSPELAKRLRERAARHHRSLQGELMSILEQSLTTEHRLSPAEVLERVKQAGLKTAAESVEIVRADRRGH